MRLQRSPLSKVQAIIERTFIGFPVRDIAEELCISKDTAFTWRHKLLDALRPEHERTQMGNVVQADEKYLPVSYKGNHNRDSFIMTRSPKKRGRGSKRGLSTEQVGVASILNGDGAFSMPCSLGNCKTDAIMHSIGYRIKEQSTLCSDGKNSCTTLSQIRHLKHCRFAGKDRAYQDGLTINGINSYHRHMEGFLNCNYKGVSTKFLPNYLVLFDFARCKKSRFQNHNLIKEAFRECALNSMAALRRMRSSRDPLPIYQVPFKQQNINFGFFEKLSKKALFVVAQQIL